MIGTKSGGEEPTPSLPTGLQVGWVIIILLVLGRLWWLPAHAPLNVNEGWNAGQTMRALGGQPLYPAPDALIANNYPPCPSTWSGASALCWAITSSPGGS